MYCCNCVLLENESRRVTSARDCQDFVFPGILFASISSTCGGFMAPYGTLAGQIPFSACLR